MDNIYDNLENYEDENIASELKKENGELKFKLEEYANTMDKLQRNILQDFDNLSSEFKKLEINYSSLLKTARQEIERKTQIINKLNQEKDMMVLNAIQNKNMPHYRRNFNMSKPPERDLSNDRNKAKSKNIDTGTDHTKVTNTNMERKAESRFSSIDTVTSISTEKSNNMSKFPQASKPSNEVESLRSGHSIVDAKENISQTQTLMKEAEKSNNKASSIKNRRKSMPAVRSEVKFSSDDECDDKYNEPKQTNSVRVDNNRETMYNTYKDRYRFRGVDEKYRTSEASSYEDKFSRYPEANKDYTYHKTSNNNYFNTDKYRPRDRYDNPQKYRRHYSPERLRRTARNYPDELFSRHEYTRLRVLESPPDKFHNYHRRNRETWSKYERDDPYDYEKSYDRHQDKYSVKHKLHSEFEEPFPKRQRNNSNVRSQEEQKHWHSERGPIQNPNPAVVENKQQEYISCQSPDYIMMETSAQPIREIRHTATMQLEDPRKSSKKYSVQTVDNHSILTTTVGRDVNLETINTSNWNIPHFHTNQPGFEIPKALTRRPSQCSDISDQTYETIEDPVSKMSKESDEIFDEPFDDRLKTMPELKGVSEKRCLMAEYDNKPKIPNTRDFDKSIDSYKIPKIKDKHIKNDSNLQLHENQANMPHLLEDQKKNLHDIPMKTDNTFAINKIMNDSKTNASTKKEIVQGDLELSDEASDNLDLHMETLSDKTNEKHQNNTNISTIFKSTLTKELNKNSKSLKEKETEPKKETNKQKNYESDDKKHKSKKRSQILSSSEASKQKNLPIADRKSKPKKDKKDANEIKAKITELFGESSSLITPEDLGLAAFQAVKQPSTATYLPICEDAQDAIDVNVSDSCKTRLTELKTVVVDNVIDNTTTEDKTEIKINSKSKRKKLIKNGVSIDQGSKTEISINKNVRRPSHATDVSYNKFTEKEQSTPKLLLVEASSKVVSNESPPELKDKIKLSDTRDDPLNANVNGATISQGLPDLTDKIMMEVDEPVKAITTLKPDVLIKALATFSPHKEFTPVLTQCGARILPQSDIKVPLTDSNLTDQSSNNDTLDSQNDADAPDVRIFVKRRRKIRHAKPS